MYCPKSFAPKLFGAPGETYTNGERGVVDYAGVTAETARTLLTALPAGNLADRQGDSPKVATLLAAAAEHPGKVEVGGYIVGPDRSDERVSVDEVLVFDDTLPDDAGHAWPVLSQRYGLDEAAGMPSMRRTEVPWRPGEKAWSLFWN